MFLEKIKINAFGKIRQFSIEFHPNFNLIYGPNEAGKSTFQQAILHLLYGFYQSNRATPQETFLLERFQPWQNSLYGGLLQYKLKNGNCYQVSRDFSDPDIPTQVSDALTGKDITNDFVVKRHGNISFLKEQIGLEKELFESTVFVRQAEVKAIAGSEYLMNEIMGVIDSGTKDKSAKKAITHLQQEIAQIGSDRAQTKPLPQAKKKYQLLNEELDSQNRAREELKQAIIQKNQLTKQIEKENIRRIELNYQILTRSIDIKEKQLSRLRFLNKELENLNLKFQDYKDVAEFPEELRETIIRRRQNRKNYEEQLQEKNQTILDLKEQVNSLEKEIGHLKNYEKVYSLMPYKEFVNFSKEWSHRNQIYSDAQSMTDQEELTLLKDGIDPKSLQELSNLNPADFSNYRQKEEEVKQLEQEYNHIQQQLEQLESKTWAKRGIKNLILFGTSGLTLIVLLGSFFFKFIYGYPASAVVIIIGLMFFQFYRKAREKIGNRAEDLEEQLRNHFQTKETKRNDFQKLYQRFGVNSLDDLMTRRVQNEHYLRLVVDREKAFQEVDRVEFQLLKYLQTVKINKIDEDILKKVDQDYQQFSNLFEKIHSLKLEISQIEKNIDNIKTKLIDNDATLDELFSRINVQDKDQKISEDDFEDLLQRKKELNALKRENEKLKSEINGILATHSESDIHSDLEDLIQRRELLLANYPDMQKKNTNWKLPLLERNYTEVDLKRQQHEKELQVLQTKIDTVLEQHRPKAEIEEEMIQVENEIIRLEKIRSNLEMAKEILTKVALDYHRNVVPFINSVLSEAMNKITKKRYTEVFINPDDLSLNLMIPEKNSLGSSDVLSLGTQEQVYLILRIALAKLLSQNMEPLPLLLDDPFVHFDHKRMGNMLHFLMELSKDNQILLFTKEPFIFDWCRNNIEKKSYSSFELQNLLSTETESPVL